MVKCNMENITVTPPGQRSEVPAELLACLGRKAVVCVTNQIMAVDKSRPANRR
ncbi:MAG: hypothetical protein M0P30_14700 [Syntrophorhabdaceae bacterium]|nr:hypothetical protein [Syntrophorhabdaceae bacterium]HOC46740.1 hypothetical protein [Syntrophorhabdaceae bacterium]